MTAAHGSIEEKARAIAERVAASEGLEVVEVEWKGGGKRGALRIFIDKPDGVTLEDCETVSRQVSTILDVEDVVAADNYHLEVSSPGLDRKLLKLQDYQRFVGKKAKVKFRDPIDGKKQVTGRLAAASEQGDIELDLGAAGPLTFSIEQVDQARLVIEI